MNRRNYILSLFGMGAGVGFTSTYLTKPTIASNINIDDIEIPENNANLPLKFNFSKFKLNTININTNKNIKIEVTIINTETNNEISTREFTFSINKRNNENKNIVNELEPIQLGKIESLNNKGDVIPIEFKIRISHEDIDDIIKKETVNIKVTESDISDKTISHHFDDGPYGSSTSSTSVDIRDTKNITEFAPVSGEYQIDVEFIEDGTYAGDESADYELGVQLIDEEENIVDSISKKFTVENTTTVTGSDTGVFDVENNEYTWRFYLASNGATTTTFSPNNPDNEGFIDLYQL